MDWMEEKRNDEEWLTKFLPKDIKTIRRRVMKMVNSLRIAGYNITGIEILEQELKKIISHELEFYMSVQVDRSREKAQIKALLRNMKAMVERITDHKETDVV